MAKASTFRDVVLLLAAAEKALIRKIGLINPDDRVPLLRGIYYGTEWSLDYKVERKRSEAGARIRNIGFITYTGGTLPADPRPALGDALFNDLQQSQSMHQGGLGIDIGHVLIGLETRSHLATRSVPFSGQGGTGIEIVTWLGDLGGGAASLARKRVSNPSTSVQVIFNNPSSDYGVMDNLEGDAGGYLVASGTSPGGPTVYGNTGIAEAMGAYLPVGSTALWSTRAARFATALGGVVGPSGITNAPALTDSLTDKLYDFAVWYALTRWIPSGELVGPSAIALCMHVKGACREVATVFVRALARALASPSPSTPIQASGPYPVPTPPGPCESISLKAAARDPSSVSKQLQEWRKDLGKLFE